MIKVVTQVVVLAGVLKSQPDGPLLAVLSILPGLTQYFSSDPLGFRGVGGTCCQSLCIVYMVLSGMWW